VNREIARPFLGGSGAYTRTPNRRDYALEPPPSVLDRLAASDVQVHAVGKICDIYCGHGIATSVRVADNEEAMTETVRLFEGMQHGVVFTNLNDFDTKFGHRRDVRGYAQALERFDRRLAELLALLGPADGVILTADHGCDPTAPGTDHTREFVPYLEIGSAPGASLGTIEGLDHVGNRLSSLFLAKKGGATIRSKAGQ
jgi:phosphopentomutase